MDEAPLAFAERWRRQLHAVAASRETDSEQPTTAAELVKKLVLELNERARDLPAYELQKCQRELESVQKGLNESAAKATPKPKFAFKRRTAPPPLPASDKTPPLPPAPPPRLASNRPAAADGGSGGGGGAPADALMLANQSRAYLSRADLPNRTSTDSTTPRDNAESQYLALTALSECVVDLLEPTVTEGEDGGGSSGTRSMTPATSSLSLSSYSAVYLSDLRDSLVLLPENAQQGSVLVQNCSRCVFILGGHQIRIHDSQGCSFFLAAGSQPIIERCRELVFGPYPSRLLASNRSPNRFDAVQDFDDPFATSSRPSRNWRLATEAERASLDEALARYLSSARTSRDGGGDGGQAERGGQVEREGLLQSVMGRA